MNYEDIRNFEERAYGPEGHGNPHAKDAVTKMEFIIHLLLDEIDELRDYIEAQIKKYPVYTATPQRKWQGLTDAEMQDCCDGYGILTSYHRGLIRRIEAELKDRNT
jgi:hypothetical protein